MTERGSVVFGSSQIAYSIVRSARRQKTVELTVNRSGDIVIAAPVRTSVPKLEAIVRRRAPWILRHGGIDDPGLGERNFATGESLPYLGRRVGLRVQQAAPDRGVDVRFEHWQFVVRVAMGLEGDSRRQAIVAAFTGWYRQRAGEHVAARVARYGALLGVLPSRVLVRDQGHRWGSCSLDGVLRFNWRIVMAPPALLDYVVIHELAHLKVRTHRSAYWALVAQAVPDYRERRERLRALGPSLAL